MYELIVLSLLMLFPLPGNDGYIFYHQNQQECALLSHTKGSAHSCYC